MKRKLLAAFGKVDITPEENVKLRGYPSRDFAVDVATGILDRIYARVLLLDDGDRRVLIVNVDSCSANEAPDPSGNGSPNYTFPYGTVRNWASVAGTDEMHVSLYATHTHGAPAYFSDKYVSRITEEIKRICGRLQPVSVMHGTGTCSIAVNRRPDLKPNFTLPLDRTMDVLVLESSNGRLLGAIVTAAVHPTVLWNIADRVTADVVGNAVKRWEEELGDSFVALFFQGFSGDVGPLAGGPKGGEVGDTYFLVQSLGKLLLSDIRDSLRQLHPIDAAPLVAFKESLTLPTKPGFHVDHKDVTLMGIRLGEAALLSASLEVFNGHKAPIQAVSPFKLTIMSGIANGYDGYLPTREAFEDQLGGYEMNVTPYTAEATSPFQTAAARLLERLYHQDCGEGEEGEQVSSSGDLEPRPGAR
ncbi:hypothetical protein [Paenibacillus koleovorans]|uniref:hypothetical protein n=1 Tax=Paenibacillus koleovorans TaxID=121608 RepID=UPI000FDC9436|nr:hypothetical protein [Paenibacillus koleovorans]